MFGKSLTYEHIMLPPHAQIVALGISFLQKVLTRIRAAAGSTPDSSRTSPQRHYNRLGGTPPDSSPLNRCIIPGIENVGNSCYLTQVLELLYTNHFVRKYIVSRHHQIAISRSSSAHNKDNCMACMFCELGDQFYHKMVTGNKVHPGRIVKAFCSRSGMQFGIQHDCSEAYTKMIDMLIMDTKGDDTSSGSGLADIFHSTVHEVTTCNKCHVSISSSDSTSLIYVPIPKGAFSFQDCLEPRTSAIDDFRCQCCGMYACMHIHSHAYACICIPITLAIMRV